MLNLRRKVGQTITCGAAQITVIKIRGSAVVLGVTAPPEVRVDRTERLPPNLPTLEQKQDAASQGAYAYVNEGGDVVYRKFD